MLAFELVKQTGRGQVFNIVDAARPSRMSEQWPCLAQYFGLKGVGPVDDATALKPGDYVKKHHHVFEEHGIKASRVFKGERLDGHGYNLTFDRWLSSGQGEEDRL